MKRNRLLGAVKEYRRLTLFEEIRWFIDDMNDARRVRKAREDYVREEGEHINITFDYCRPPNIPRSRSRSSIE